MAKTKRQHDTAPFKEPATWLCLTILAAVPLVLFRDILLGNAFLWEDFLYLTYPIRTFAATSLSRGEIPLWNPYTFGGMPFLADLTTTVLYLPCTLLVLAVHKGSLGVFWVELVNILHFILAGISMFFLARSYGIRKGPALFSGVTYMLSGFMMVHAIHLSILAVVAWFPLILLLFRNVLLRKEWMWVFLCAVVLGHSLLAGFLQLSLYFYVFLFAYFLFELVQQNLHRAIFTRAALMITLRAAAVVVLSLAVSMVQFLPAQEMSELSFRAQITYEKASEGSLAWQQLLTFLFPKFFGTAGATGYPYWGPGAYWYFWETCIYLGVLPFVLMLLSVLFTGKYKHIILFLGVGVFAVLYALGDNFFLHRLMFDIVPGFSRFRVPARAAVFLPFSAALLSGFTLQGLMYDEAVPAVRARITKLLAAIAGTGLLLWLLITTGAFDGSFRFLSSPQVSTIVHKDVTLAGLLFIASISLLFYIVRRKSRHPLVVLLLPALLFIDMMMFGANQNNGKTNPEEYFKQPARLLGFLKRESETEFFRINSRNSQGMVMDRNQGMFDRIFTMEGYTPLALQRLTSPVGGSIMFDLMNVKYKTVTNEKDRTVSLESHPTYLPRAFFLYAFNVVWNEQDLQAYMKSSEFHHRTTALLEKDPGVILKADTAGRQWKAHVREYRDNSITLDVETDRDGLLVLSEIYYPGWHAIVDGNETEIFRTDYNLRSLVVPAGKHEVVMKFQPASFVQGGLITIGSLLLCVAGGAVSFSRHRRRSIELAQENPRHRS
jgi:hypothetical protein